MAKNTLIYEKGNQAKLKLSLKERTGESASLLYRAGLELLDGLTTNQIQQFISYCKEKWEKGADE